MTEDSDRIALIDLDGTVADYDGSMQRYMRILASPDEPKYTHRPVLDDDEVPHLRVRRKLVQQLPGFWRQLKPIPLGFEVVDVLRKSGFELHVLTKGPKTTPTAWTEKVEWCAQHLPDVLVTVTSKKSLVYGRVLVDDWPPYFEEWLRVRPRGLIVCVAQPWNEDYAPGGPKEHPNVIRYDGGVEVRAHLAARIFNAYMRPSGQQP